MIKIPIQLQKQAIRLVLLKPKSKIPFEKNWQTTVNYKFDDPKLIQHLKVGGNYGIIGGFGNLRVLDIDNKELAEEFKKKINTFTVRTGSGGMHFYFISEYDKNHVFVNEQGELRAKAYQVVGSDCIHPNGKKYQIINDKTILKISSEELYKLIKPYLRDNILIPGKKTINIKSDSSRSAKEYREVIRLIGQGKNKEETFKEMSAFSKWSSAPEGYRELTYNKAKQYVNSSSTQSNPLPPTTTQSNPLPPQKKKERDFLVKSLLSKEREEVVSIKSGIHKGSLYYGTLSATGNQLTINDKKEVFVDWGKNKNEIRDHYELNYRYDFEFQALDGHFSISAVNSWIEGTKEPKTIKKIFEIIEENNKKFMYYPDKILHKIISLDIISTYFLPLFEAKGRGLLVSEAGSGKTRQCILYKLLAFNTIMSSDISKSAFFRIMESTCGTLIIDDFDSINEEQKNDILQHYKTGYKAGNKAVRTGDKSRKIDAFRNFGHCVMNNTTGLDPISLERSISYPILKTDKENITKADINEKSKNWQELRDYLFLCSLKYWKDVQQAYNSVVSELKSRHFEISRSILAIASLVSPELQKEVDKWLLENLEDLNLTDFETDWTFLAIKQFKDLEDNNSLVLKEIAKTIDPYADVGKIRGICTFLGKTLKNLPFFKSTYVNGVRHLKLLSKQKYIDYLKAKGWYKVVQGGTGSADGLIKTEEETIEDPKEDLQEVNGQGNYTRCKKCNYEGILRFYDSKNNWYCEKCEI